MANLRPDSRTGISKSSGRAGRGRARRTISLALATLFVVILLATAGFITFYQQSHANLIYPGVTVAEGLHLGNLTLAEATDLLEQRAASTIGQEMRLRYRDREWTITFEDLGVRSNARDVAVAAYSVGRRGNLLEQLSQQLDSWRYGHRIDTPILTVDGKSAGAIVAKLAKEIDRPTIDARLRIDDSLTVGATPSQIGRQLDAEATLQQLDRALATLLPDEVDLPVRETQPAVVEADLRSAMMLANKTLSSPFILAFQDRTWTLPRQDIRDMLIVDDQAKNVPDRVIRIDERKVNRFVNRLAPEIDQEMLKARLEFNGGQLRITREGRPGFELDAGSTAATVMSRLATDNRSVALPVRVTQPPGTTGDRSAIKELVASATTSYAGGLPERSYNIELAASKLNGTVVGPGEIFSFNEELGPMSTQEGFKWGWGISQSQGQVVTIPSVAGGICQVSTTLFQAIFWAGYQIEERNWHLYWIERYGQPPLGMKGLDATVDQVYDRDGNLVSAVDLKFANTTQFPILIEARANEGQLTFSLYSTKPGWTVNVSPPVIADLVKANPAVVREVDWSLPPGREIWVEAAQDGFKATVVRTVTEEGKDPRVLKLVSTYQPSRNVARVGPSR